MPAPIDPALTDLTYRLTILVASVDGVDRLHPTLRQAVASVAAGVVDQARRRPTDGLTRPGARGLDLYHRYDHVDVSVDLSTTADRSAVAVCRSVRQTVQEAVRRADYQPGTITITVVDVVA